MKIPFPESWGEDPENSASFDVLIANNSGTNYSKGRRKTSSQALSSFFDLYLFCNAISKSILQRFVLLSLLSERDVNPISPFHRLPNYSL